MRNVHSAMRPFWAINAAEIIVFGLTIVVSPYVVETLSKWVVHIVDLLFAANSLSPTMKENLTNLFGGLIVLIAWSLLFICYRSIKKFAFPSSYIYCFKRREKNGNQLSVIGFFHLRCGNSGVMNAKGASFDLIENQLKDDSRVGWQSDLIGGKKENEVEICFILYHVDERDRPKRQYTHGLLQFDALKKEAAVIRGKDVYHGHMQATDRTSISIFENAYGERVGGEIAESELKELLRQHGEQLMERWEKDLKRT